MNFDKAHKRLDEFPDIIDKVLITRKEFRYCIHSILEALEGTEEKQEEKKRLSEKNVKHLLEIADGLTLDAKYCKIRYKLKAEYEETQELEDARKRIKELEKEHNCFYRCKAEAFERDAMSLRKDLDACRDSNGKWKEEDKCLKMRLAAMEKCFKDREELTEIQFLRKSLIKSHGCNEELLEEIGLLKRELDEKGTCRHSDKVIKHLKEKVEYWKMKCKAMEKCFNEVSLMGKIQIKSALSTLHSVPSQQLPK